MPFFVTYGYYYAGSKVLTPIAFSVYETKLDINAFYGSIGHLGELEKQVNDVLESEEFYCPKGKDVLLRVIRILG